MNRSLFGAPAPLLVMEVDSEVTVSVGNGSGSTNSSIRIFSTIVRNVGSAITYATSAANAASFTINEAGLYDLYWNDSYSGGGGALGFSLNSTQLTTSISSITAANRLAYVATPTAATVLSLSRTVRLAVGDVIRPHHSNSFDGTTLSVFSIRKVGA